MRLGTKETLMRNPFFYFEIISRSARSDMNRTVYDVVVRCANQGYGHHHDPVMVRVTEMESVEEGLEEAYQVMADDVHILSSEEYAQEMGRVLEAKRS